MDAFRPARWVRHRRPTGFEQVRHDLGTTALRFASALGPAFAVAYGVGYGLTRRPALLVLTALGLVAGLDSIRRVRAGDPNTALLVVVGGLSYAAAWPIVSPVVRSGLAAPMLAIAVVAALTLTGRTRVGVIGVLAAIVAAQTAWPLFGFGSAQEALTHTLVTGGALFFALLAVGLALLAVEASESEQRETAGQAGAERFQSVFDLAPIAIWEQDWSAVAQGLDELRKQGVTDLRAHLAAHRDEFFRLIEAIRFTDVNPAGMRIIGAQTRQEAFENVVHRDSPPEVIESLVTQLDAMWLGLDRVSFDFIGQSVDNEPLDITLIWGVGRTRDGALDPSRVIVVLADVSEARVAQRQLASLIASKDELVASVSHELRTPIASIMGMAYELRDRGAEFSDEERTELLAVIADQSREVANIVEDLLVATRADVENLTMRPELLLLADEIRRVVANEKSPIAVAIEADEDTTAWVDPLRLRQILRNLLSNARRYGGDTVTVRVRTDPDRVVVEVVDDGPGVPPGDEEDIFQPYIRDHSDRALPGSIGLGLSVSRRLARLMGGDLVYRREDGSVFELSLPLPEHG